MLKVQISSQLLTALTASGQSPELLMSKFSEWKLGDPDDHYWFGRDVKGSSGLYHVHMVPRNDLNKKKQWDISWGRPGYSKRDSDRYLLYANGGPRLGYLLIDLLEDPGAHGLWAGSQKSRLAALELVADNFIYAGKVP